MKKILFIEIMCIMFLYPIMCSSLDNRSRQFLQYANPRTITIDKFNNKWIGTLNYGLYKFDGDSLINYNTKNSGIQTNIISCIFCDDNGDIWLGTDKGIIIYDRKVGWEQFHPDNSGLPGSWVGSIVKDENGYFWIGTNLGLAKFTRKDKTIKIFTVPDLDGSDVISHLFIDSRKILIVVMDLNQGGLSLFYIKDGTLQGFCKNNYHGVYSIAEDKDGFLWAATDDGLLKITDIDDPDNNHLLKNSSNSIMPFNSCYSVLVDKKNNVWFSNSGGIPPYENALVKYISNRQDFVPYFLPDLGWSENFYHRGYMVEDKCGNIWVCASTSLYAFNENGIDTTCFLSEVKYDIGIRKELFFLTPNPTSDNISIFLSNSDFSNISISIFNSLGIEIKRFYEKELSGQNSINFSTIDFPEGVYFCTFKSLGNNITKSFVVVR